MIPKAEQIHYISSRYIKCEANISLYIGGCNENDETEPIKLLSKGWMAQTMKLKERKMIVAAKMEHFKLDIIENANLTLPSDMLDLIFEMMNWARKFKLVLSHHKLSGEYIPIYVVYFKDHRDELADKISSIQRRFNEGPKLTTYPQPDDLTVSMGLDEYPESDDEETDEDYEEIELKLDLDLDISKLKL